MSEFERTPESMRAELAGLESKLLELNNQLNELPDGNYAETGSLETAENIMGQASALKRASLDILLSLGDINTIKEKLESATLEAVELYGDEGIPVYVETIVEDIFGIELDETADARLQTVIDQLIKKHGLMTFDSEEEPEE